VTRYSEQTGFPQFALWDKVAARRVPLSLHFEITERCNNNCRHCCINVPADDVDARRRELSLDEIRAIADQAAELGTLWCLLTGGEPLLRDDFQEIYLHLKQKGLLVSIYTNATLVDRPLVELLKRYPPRDLEVTVYGTTEASYEAITRVAGSFAAFERGMALLQEVGVPVRLKAMLMRSNVSQLDAARDYAHGQTKDYFRFDPFLHLRLRGEPGRNRSILAERLSPEEIVAVELADPERRSSLESSCEKIILSDIQDSGLLFRCGAGREGFAVGAYGDFRLCASLVHPDTVYDLRGGTLREAWNDFTPQVLCMHTESEACRQRCLRCPIINLCIWCPAVASLECGELDRPVEYFCQVAHARAWALGVLDPGTWSWEGARPAGESAAPGVATEGDRAA
jgi:radical SAM protein with 4Fe4S-binding SPASM domain